MTCDRETLAGKFVSVMLHGEPPMDAVSSVRIALRLLAVVEAEGLLDVVDAEVVDFGHPDWSPSTELLNRVGAAAVEAWKAARSPAHSGRLGEYDSCVRAGGAALREAGVWVL